MGFGFLVYGYLMLIDYGVEINADYGIGFDIFPDILGYILFFLALKNLSRHAKGFSRAKSICTLLIFIGAVTLVAQLFSLTGIWLKYLSIILNCTEYVKYPLLLLLHIGIMDGIHSLALDVDLPKLSDKASIGKIISIIYYCTGICMIVYELGFGTPTGKAATIYSSIGICFQILFYLMFFYNFCVLFSSYRQICYEGDENMDEPEKNPLSLLYNKIKEKTEKSDESDENK